MERAACVFLVLQVTLALAADSAGSACREYRKEDSDQCFIDRRAGPHRGLEAVAESKEFPHMAMIGCQWGGRVLWICDGALISPRFVLTVAYCMNSKYGIPRWVRVGDRMSIGTTDPVQPQEVAVAETIVHPDFKPPAFYNDIALLRLEKDVKLNKFVRPACIHTGGDVKGRAAILTFWRGTNIVSGINLTRVEERIQPLDKCASSYSRIFNSTKLSRGLSSESMVCAGGERPTCMDRSGSPIQLIRDDAACMYDIVGLSSFGKPCGIRKSFVVYSRVSYYVPWIEEIVWGSACRKYSKVVKSDQCFIDRGLPNRWPEAVAEPKEFPHMAILGFQTEEGIEWLCDGVLISPRYVLTAADCMSHSAKPQWVRIGDIISNETTVPVRQQEVAVAEIIPHPDYKPPALYNDIALIKLEKNVELNEFVRPACLHTGGDVEGKTGILTGWGRTAMRSTDACVNLTRVEQRILSIVKCNDIITSKARLRYGLSSESMICIGGYPTCVDKAGSPIQLIRDDTDCMYDIVGLSSFGKLCGANNSLTIHTRVSYYVPWIEKIVWGTGSA